ncbi:MAG: Rid family detoxifying hydrolase [Acidimicrobiales bacterium]|nr:Rid family detoxifying hydrolase [Acidimicrobiales bacterium]
MSKPVGPYSPALRAGEWLVCSGQIGAVEGRLVEGGFEPELRQVLANLEALLDSHGARMTDVVKTTVFLADMADFALLNEVYVAAFGDHRPARSAVGVAALPLGARVEIEAWVHLG